jgi:hypothetical protein
VVDSVASEIHIFEMASGRTVRDVRLDDMIPSALAMADDGRVALEPVAYNPANAKGSVILLDASTTDARTGRRVVHADPAVSYTAPVFLPDGRFLVAEQRLDAMGRPTGEPATLVVLDETGRPLQSHVLEYGVADLAVAGSGHLLVTGTDGVLRGFDGSSWQEIGRGYTAADW